MQLLKNTYGTRLLLLIPATISGNILFAQTAAPAQEKTNMLAVMMLLVAAILAFVIWGLSRILLALGKEVVRASKVNTGKVLPLIFFVAFSLIANIANAQEIVEKKQEVSSFNYGGLSSTSFWFLASVIIMEVIAILFMALSISSLYKTLKPSPVKVKEESKRWKALWESFDKKFLTRAVAVEKEADILLDHNYDGIRELDNSLPPWWKYGFIITIIAAFIYLFNFHVMGTGKNPTQEYQAEMKRAEDQLAAYNENNKDRVDEANVQMDDAAGIAEGKIIFSQTCFPCHGKSAEGGVGPNLTDEYWLHGGSLNDIYHTIKVGYPDKGMQGWTSQFSPKQMSLISSYIKSLKGSKPANAKDPQGDIYKEENKIDSTVVAIKK
ncbi:cbb3-type cytochrome c oxidase N-terminal domain-containing protein [soil metagenome]